MTLPSDSINFRACKHSIHSYTTIYRSREKDGEGVPLDSHDFTSHRKDGGSRGVTSVPLNSIVFCPLYHRFSLIIHPSHIIALFNHRSYTYIILVFPRLLYKTFTGQKKDRESRGVSL